MCTAGIMIRKLFILGLVVAACLVLTQGKSTFQAEIEDYAEALIQGIHKNTVVHAWNRVHKIHYNMCTLYHALL